MGCCGSSAADKLDRLSEKQRHNIAECCQGALLQDKPDLTFTWIVTKLSTSMQKSQDDIFKMITTDKQPCGRIANKPDHVDGNKSLVQILGSCQRTAKMFIMAKYADDLKATKKLELGSDEEVNEFVDAAVHAEIRKALVDRIDEILHPDGHPDSMEASENNNNNNNQLESKKSSGNLKSGKTSSVEPTSSYDDKPAVSKAQQQKVASGKEPTKTNTASKKTTTAAAAAATTNNNNKSNSSNNTASSPSSSTATAKASTASAARARKNIIQQKQQGPPPAESGPKHKDNKWAPCEDCEYYWNEYKELYYDPIKKLFYNEGVGRWVRTEPALRK